MVGDKINIDPTVARDSHCPVRTLEGERPRARVTVCQQSEGIRLDVVVNCVTELCRLDVPLIGDLIYNPDSNTFTQYSPS